MSSINGLECFDDPKYRTYASQVEKVLKNFEYSTEWADLISALIKLNKVLQANACYKFLPKRITIGKRLSQCMHPALPGGVHIKALDVYDTIFKIIGPKRLELDLCIYGAGIFSLLANASMQVRPVLLNVYETHLLPIGKHLRTSLDGLILSLLPGLEEGSEHFDRINLLLDKIAKSVGLQVFYSSVWRCVISSPSGSVIRLAAMQLVLRQFDKKKMTDDQLYLIGLDVDMMVQSVCEALQDENVLTQRATLDVLTICFPLSALPVSRADAQAIFSSAIYILLRRDMSLNRRLYSWILGNDMSKNMSKGSSTSVKESFLEYFEKYSKSILIEAFLEIIEKLSHSFISCCCRESLLSVAGSEVKFIRVIISLLDRTEIGPGIINDTLVNILRLFQNVTKSYALALSPQGAFCKICSMTLNCNDICSRSYSEFVKSVNLFIGSFETDFIWDFMGEKFCTVCLNDVDLTNQSEKRSNFSHTELCDIVETLICIVSMETYVEIQTIYLPELLNTIFIEMNRKCHLLSGKQLVSVLNLSLQIMKHIQPFQPGNLDNQNNNKHNVESCAKSFQKFLISFISIKILREKDSVDRFWPDIKKERDNTTYPHGYELLLKYPKVTKKHNRAEFKTYDEEGETILHAFKDSCKILVDICCFPMLRRGNSIFPQLSIYQYSSTDLPDWMKCLVVCACCTKYEDASLIHSNLIDKENSCNISITACSTILELMALTATASMAHTGDSSDSIGEHALSVVSVVVPPPLFPSHLTWLHEESNFYEQTCLFLWTMLGTDYSSIVSNSTDLHPICAHLLVLLHQLCPDETIERILLQDILAVDQNFRVDAIKKFTKLWHFIPDSTPHSQIKGTKTFSRCLFAILDQLPIDRYALFPDFLSFFSVKGQAVVSTTVSTWLRHVLEDGDICRILEPYILILLHSQTHRKSLYSVLQLKKELSNSEVANDEFGLFQTRQNENGMHECDDCLEIQRQNQEDISPQSKYRNFSIDSVIIGALCEVHHKMAQERQRYGHLVALLTLSDELESEIMLDGTCSEDSVPKWIEDFVDMVIDQGLALYKSRFISLKGFHVTESVSEDSSVGLSTHQMGLEAVENNYSSCDSVVSQAEEATELNVSKSHTRNYNPLYQHILVYQEHFDVNRVLYSLQGILNVISAHPGVFIHAACTTSLASSRSAHLHLVQELLVRHERTINQGGSFYEFTTPTAKGTMKNRMLIEVLMSICLYYMRSSFQTMQKNISEYAVVNHEIQCMATMLLRHIIKELTVLAQQDEQLTNNQSTKLTSTTKQVSAYIISVLQKHQVQSTVLTCLLSTIFAIEHPPGTKQGSMPPVSGTDITSNSEYSHFDSFHDERIIFHYLGGNVLHATTLFSHFLGLTFDLIKLERFAFPTKSQLPLKGFDSKLGASILLNRKNGKPKTKQRTLKLMNHLISVSNQYDPDTPIAGQTIFISTLLEIYKLDTHPQLHQECSILLKFILPCLGGALSRVVIPVLLHQCMYLENSLDHSVVSLPSNYIESSIKSIASLVHYCLLNESVGKNMDRANADGGPSDTVSLNTARTNQSNNGGSSIGSGLYTLLNVFNTSNSTKSNAVDTVVDWSDAMVAAKVAILNNLARIVSCMCLLWREMGCEQNHTQVSTEKSKTVSYNILQFLGPLAMQYGEYLLVAFALVWHKRGKSGKYMWKPGQNEKLGVENCDDNKYIIDVMLAIKLLSAEMLFSLVKQVLKNPPHIPLQINDLTHGTLQESILQMLLLYIKRQKPATLTENWSGFSVILQEILSLGTTQTTSNMQNAIKPVSPNCYFLLLHLLSEFVKRSNQFTQKKEQRELQEIAGKCIEACNFIAGSSLEQSTWMRRNISVLPGPQVPEGLTKTHIKTESQSSIDLTEVQHINLDMHHEMPVQTSSSDTLLSTVVTKQISEIRAADDIMLPESVKDRTNIPPTISHAILNPLNFRNSVRALTVLSEVVANLLDVVYSSEEREKVLPVLTSIMANVTPYLRNHSADNVPSFCACVSFLASISGFQHTRRAWRKDITELYLDTLFFHMPLECINGWQTIIDNLMTHDKTTFKEVMSRMSLSRSGPSAQSLNIFSNKEQESEIRALHMKRLAFVIFSSEVNQYQKQLPDIQERLAESLRFHNVPGVQCQVFFCFRVLLLRISPHSLMSLWPTMFTELVHVMLQLEQSLNPGFLDDENKSNSRTKSSRSNSPTSPQPTKTVMNCWLNMYLSACKLLDLALCLPVNYVPQFQLYRWSFVGEPPSEPDPHPNPPSKNTSTTQQDEKSEEIKPDPTFIPHCVRIQRLFSTLHPKRAQKTLKVVPGKPLLNIRRLKSIDELQLFFNTITTPLHLFSSQTSLKSGLSSYRNTNYLGNLGSMPLVEKVLQRDFVRPML